MTKAKYIYCWRNNPKRAELYGRPCKVVARGKMNSCMVESANKRADKD